MEVSPSSPSCARSFAAATCAEMSTNVRVALGADHDVATFTLPLSCEMYTRPAASHVTDVGATSPPMLTAACERRWESYEMGVSGPQLSLARV